MSLRKTAAAGLATTISALERKLPGAIRDRLPQGSRQLIRALLRRNRSRVASLSAKLWGGYSVPALAELHAIADGAAASQAERHSALQELIYWYSISGEVETCLRLAEQIGLLAPTPSASLSAALSRLLIMSQQGLGERVIAELASSPRLRRDPSVQFVLANCSNPTVNASGSASAALAHFNAALASHRLAPLSLIDPNRGLSLDNIKAADPLRRHDNGPVITVIVPAYNAEATIETALRSLAEQTWLKLDVIVVDDASTDTTANVAVRFAQADSRFRVLTNHSNVGSYVSRNRALELARGEYITVLDADDWAHPERLEQQFKTARLLRTPFNMSHWVRVSSELVVYPPFRASTRLTSPNLASFFFSSDLPRQIGAWDEARVSADREYIKRAEIICKRPWSSVVKEGAPLTFGRFLHSSLTQSHATHLTTARHGVRREYHEWTEFFLEQVRRRELDVAALPDRYRQTTPALARSIRSTPQVDLLVISDWTATSDEAAKTLILEARKRGRKAGIFHYPRYDGVVDRPLSRALREWLFDNEVRTIAAGEACRADVVVVSAPEVFLTVLDRFPKIEFRRLLIDSDGASKADVEIGSRARTTIVRNLHSLLGAEGHWCQVRPAMDLW